jgi:hypothetical protein
VIATTRVMALGRSRRSSERVNDCKAARQASQVTPPPVGRLCYREICRVVAAPARMTHFIRVGTFTEVARCRTCRHAAPSEHEASGRHRTNLASLRSQPHFCCMDRKTRKTGRACWGFGTVWVFAFRAPEARSSRRRGVRQPASSSMRRGVRLHASSSHGGGIGGGTRATSGGMPAPAPAPAPAEAEADMQRRITAVACSTQTASSICVWSITERSPVGWLLRVQVCSSFVSLTRATSILSCVREPFTTASLSYAAHVSQGVVPRSSGVETEQRLMECRVGRVERCKKRLATG